MEMKINYLVKNILLGFIGLVLIVIILNSPFILALGKYSFIAWLFVAVVLVTLFLIIRKRSDKFLSGYVGERDIDDELKNLSLDFVVINKGLDTGRGNIDKIVIPQIKEFYKRGNFKKLSASGNEFGPKINLN